MDINTLRVAYYKNSDNSIDYIKLQILEKRTGKGEFSGKEQPGFLARGSDNYLYGYCYPIVPESNPLIFRGYPWVRYLPDNKFDNLSKELKDKFISKYIWWDIDQFEIKDPTTLLKIYPFLKYCPNHNRIFYTSCGKCSIEKNKEI